MRHASQLPPWLPKASADLAIPMAVTAVPGVGTHLSAGKLESEFLFYFLC